MKRLISLLLILFLLSCKQTETKKVIDKFDNGQEGVVYFYKDKADTLTYRKEVFFKSGKHNYTGNILNNKKDGIWTWWYENGNKKDQCKYADGFYVDTVYHWYANGQLKQVEIVAGRTVRTDGCCNCNGTIIRYSEQGKIQEQFTNIDNKFQGTYTKYEDNGSWVIRHYKNDTLTGFTKEHLIDTAGVLTVIIGQYQNGKETGLWKWFSKDSILTQTVVYENGEALKVTKN